MAAGEVQVDQSQIYLEVHPRDRKGRIYGTGDAAVHLFPESYPSASQSTQSPQYTATALARATAENLQMKSTINDLTQSQAELQRQFKEAEAERIRQKELLDRIASKIGIFPTSSCNQGPPSFGDDPHGGNGGGDMHGLESM